MLWWRITRIQSVTINAIRREGFELASRNYGQIVYQFAHEWTHALTSHSAPDGQWQGTMRPTHFWLEESLCEMASFFALDNIDRFTTSAGVRFKRKGGFSDYRFSDYTEELLIAAPPLEMGEKRLCEWIDPEMDSIIGHIWDPRHEEHPERKKARQQNRTVALQLLPIFKENPNGFDAMTALRRDVPPDEPDLKKYLDGWRDRCSEQSNCVVQEIIDMLIAQ